MTAPPVYRERRSVPLNLIIGRSPRNCRPAAADEKVDDLAASIEALGLLVPLLVSAVPGALLRFEVDAGGRRLAALRELVGRGILAADHKVECDVVVAEEAVVREISLAENTMRRDLHPVDQCDAFQAMRDAGHSEERIAADFAITLRRVRQRLKLTLLSPRVRAAWRDGTLSTEVAQAMTLAPSHEAQDAILDGDRWMLRNASQIRVHILEAAKAVSFDAPEAVYVGLDAYVAAGGAVEENLFDEHPLIFDSALLDRMAREKMMREGQAVLEQTGFGFCMIEEDVEWSWPRILPDYLPAETARLDEIDTAYDASGDENEDSRARWNALIDERDAIEARAIDRACTAEIKAKAGVLLSLDADGRLRVERGVQRPLSAPETGKAVTGTTPSAKGAPRTTGPARDLAPAKPADPIEAAGAGRGMIRTILEKTITAALASIVSGRPDLAMMILVARYGATFRADWIADGLGLSPHSNPDNPLLKRLDATDFDKAIDACTDVPLADLTSAFAAIVARSIKLAPHALLGSLDPLMCALGRRGGALRPAFVAAMDYESYFEAATKQACLAALDAMEAIGVDRQAKKPVLAAMAAERAKATAWLPFPLAGWADVEACSPEAPETSATIAASADARPLAQAMGEAIDADETKKVVLRQFLGTRCRISEGAAIKASVLYAAYIDSVADPISLGAFGEEITSRGVSKRRTKHGVFYQDVELDVP